jgi:hypothetical protein
MVWASTLCVPQEIQKWVSLPPRIFRLCRVECGEDSASRTEQCSLDFHSPIQASLFELPVVAGNQMVRSA